MMSKWWVLFSLSRALTYKPLHSHERGGLGRLQDGVEELEVSLVKVRSQDLHFEEECPELVNGSRGLIDLAGDAFPVADDLELKKKHSL